MALPPLISISATAMLLPLAGPGGTGANALVQLIDDDVVHAAVRPRLLKKIDRFSQIALAAVDRLMPAIASVDRSRIGVFVGNDLAGWNYVYAQLGRMIDTQDPMAIDPYVATAWFPAAGQGEISIAYQIRGPGRTFSAGALSGGLALENAAQLIAERKIDVAVAGGVEAPDAPVVLHALAAAGQISTDYPAAEAVGMITLGSPNQQETRARLATSRPRRSAQAAIADIAPLLEGHAQIGYRPSPFRRNGGADNEILRQMRAAGDDAFGPRLQTIPSPHGDADFGSAAYPIAIIEAAAGAARQPSLVLGTDFEGLYLASAVLPPAAVG